MLSEAKQPHPFNGMIEKNVTRFLESETPRFFDQPTDHQVTFAFRIILEKEAGNSLFK